MPGTANKPLPNSPKRRKLPPGAKRLDITLFEQQVDILKKRIAERGCNQQEAVHQLMHEADMLGGAGLAHVHTMTRVMGALLIQLANLVANGKAAEIVQQLQADMKALGNLTGS